ncbi:cyclin-dependent kinase inhibitor 3 [Sesamum indicum]|uniref:Cyclin-dependent kinase inhibitor 3 n=1 Tax=Sesamum indicum TaxID=4182 RepID=A0A6I9TW73_SESIN|nr:cyclin-dependent kinase inhibitor 3 [Sesamum indicum]
MGKRMNEAKSVGTVGVMDKLHHAQASIGVLTRAKTLALKKSLSSLSTSIIMEDITANNGSDGCYLQLRSRRLERRVTPLVKKAKKNKCSPAKGKKEVASLKIEEDGVEEKVDKEEENNKKDDYNEEEEGSYGDNELDLENKGRITRESTPSTLTEGSNIIKTPTSSNKSATNGNAIKKGKAIMPSAEELEAFFAPQEKLDIERFIEKYNFDPVNEKPLKGRYEWVEFKP